MAMTTLTGRGPGLKRSLGRVVGLLFAAMFVVQTVGVAFALRRKREVSLVPDPASDDVTLTSIYGPLEFASTAQAFRGGTLTCLYGGGTLDLRGATLAPGGATLRIQAFKMAPRSSFRRPGGSRSRSSGSAASTTADERDPRAGCDQDPSSRGRRRGNLTKSRGRIPAHCVEGEPSATPDTQTGHLTLDG